MQRRLLRSLRERNGRERKMKLETEKGRGRQNLRRRGWYLNMSKF